MRISPPPMPSTDRIWESHRHADRRRPCRQRPASRASGSAPRSRPGACRVQRTGTVARTVARHAADWLRSGTSGKRSRRCESRGHRQLPRRRLLLPVLLPLIADGSASYPPLSVTSGMPPDDARCYSGRLERGCSAGARRRSRGRACGLVSGPTWGRPASYWRQLPTTPSYRHWVATRRDQESATRLPALGRSAASASRYLWPRSRQREPDQFVP